MAGAEGERGLDFDADPAWRDAGAIVCAMHDEASGGNGRQARKTLAHPILGGDVREGQRLGGLSAGRGRRQRAHRLAVGRIAKVDDDGPASAAVIHKTDGRVLVGAGLGKQGGKCFGGLFTGFEARGRGLSAGTSFGSHCIHVRFRLVPAVHRR